MSCGCNGDAACGDEQAAAPRVATTFVDRPKTKVDTPSTTLPDSEQIEVTDPTHALFGRKFLLVARRGRAHERSACVLVSYRDSILIKLPLGSTNLRSVAAPAARTKLDAEACFSITHRFKANDNWRILRFRQ